MRTFPWLFCLSACAPFEGTWAFHVDPDAYTSGDCADGDGGPTYESNSIELVEIYHLASGEWVVWYEVPMTGDANSEALSAEWVETLDYDGYQQVQKLAIDATYNEGELTGLLDSELWNESESGEDYSCVRSYEFSAARVVSDSSRYPSGS